ncbi:ABC1 kinase family protein [Natranaerofaba carboxydovora]|uniref:ABC1 kinase family protein n=1 Tax=Natranaerofaba carboxydovora TaxID=2742683 RepID=UPI001F145CD5|nr:lipopolysaccharide core heptose(II) kinase RfaY [Natranaerofaba carboxydovora]UMZ75485.1 putative protein kinase UbiB [Natranaerofaba carboxydovora]
MLGKRMRHINRYREILTVFAKHGFGYLIEDLGLSEMLSPSKRFFTDRKQLRSVGAKLRLALEELGPTFIKLGQLLSTRPDLLPSDIISELDKLQDEVEPFSFTQVEEILEEELQGNPKDFFSYIEKDSLAAASIGQVHYAKLKSGKEVIIKVQRPYITSVIETDLEILKDLATQAEQRLSWAKHYQVRDVVDEFAKILRDELDYQLEARNAEKFGEIFENNNEIYVPEVYWDYSTKRVIVLEYLDGVKINHLDELENRNHDKKLIANRITEAYFVQVLKEGFFHGDPHPGNFIILPDDVVAFTDFGIVGRLTPQMKHQFIGMLLGIIKKNPEMIVKAILKLGFVPEDIDLDSFKKDVEKTRDRYYSIPLGKISFGDAINDFFKLAYRYQIRIPPDLTLLGKTFIILEGVVKKLDPDISMVDIAEPFGKELFKEKFHPKNVLDFTWKSTSEYAKNLFNFTLELKDLVTILRRGKGKLEINVPQVDLILRKLDQIGNRLSFSIVLLSFSIIMASLIIGASFGDYQPLIWQLPLIEIGFGIAALMFFWLMFAIFKSGRF